MMPPGLDAARKTLEHPETCLGFGFARKAKRRSRRLIKRHAFWHYFIPAKQPVNEFTDLAVALETAIVDPTLVVQHDHLRPTADFAKVTEELGLPGHAATVHTDPQAVGPADRAGRAIVDLPDLKTPRVVPHDPI